MCFTLDTLRCEMFRCRLVWHSKGDAAMGERRYSEARLTDKNERDERNCIVMGRERGKKILRHVTALFFDFITVLANLISERRHNITIYEWERKSFHGNGHIYYELRPRAFYRVISTFNAICTAFGEVYLVRVKFRTIWPLLKAELSTEA